MRVALRLGVMVAVAAVMVLLPSAAQAGKTVETATLDVTKVVEGDPPPGTTFTVEVECPVIRDLRSTADDWDAGPEGAGPVTATLVFGADGGTQSVGGIRFETRNCTVTETDDGGADSV